MIETQRPARCKTASLVFLVLLLVSCSEEPPGLDEYGWLYPIDACPADVIAEEAQDLSREITYCDSQVEKCWLDCWRGGGSECYALANFFQRSEPARDHVGALYLRSCALGIDSGCTNRAAGILLSVDSLEQDSDSVACSNRTFEAICDRGDAWACTMFGMSLTRAIGMEADHVRALEILPRACAVYPDDESCEYARQLMSEIDKSESGE